MSEKLETMAESHKRYAENKGPSNEAYEDPKSTLPRALYEISRNQSTELIDKVVRKSSYGIKRSLT